jgi:hypothetical protein
MWKVWSKKSSIGHGVITFLVIGCSCSVRSACLSSVMRMAWSGRWGILVLAALRPRQLPDRVWDAQLRDCERLS